MTVASLELSKELFEISGWKGTEFEWINNFGQDGWNAVNDMAGDFPAYDFEYVYNKLPKRILRDEVYYGLMAYFGDMSCWFAYQNDIVLSGEDIRLDIPNTGQPFYKRVFEADTPTNAICVVAIELFKQNILSRTASRWVN